METQRGPQTPLIGATIEFVKHELKNNDASHDWLHIERVWNLARRLARDEKLSEERMELVEIGALLHDIRDYKYSGSETAGVEAAREFLKSQGVAGDRIDIVCAIIAGVGFKKELGGGVQMFPELAVVQDADRLDAIGAIGIARCFTYGGAKKRPLYSDAKPKQLSSAEEYAKASEEGTTINHFHEKLLRLREMMKTNAGRAVAEERHRFMETFLLQFAKECRGEA